jgi:hypothetical protein
MKIFPGGDADQVRGEVKSFYFCQYTLALGVHIFTTA